jgi:hypothetical protein
MTQRPSTETVLQSTLAILVHHAGLAVEDIANLKLSDLHLAGKTPHVTVSSSADQPAIKKDLDLETHRVLVGWLVARPDSVSDHLFVDEDGALSPAEIRMLAERASPADPPSSTTPSPEQQQDATPSADETMIGTPRPAGPPPPRSGPERGSPPPGFIPPRPGFVPPSAPPEAEPPIPATGPEGEAADALPGREMPADADTLTPFPPRTPGPPKPRVPPKPVRRRKTEPVDPVLMKQKPEPVDPPLPLQPNIEPQPPDLAAVEPPATKAPAATEKDIPVVSPVASVPSPRPQAQATEPPARTQDQPGGPAMKAPPAIPVLPRKPLAPTPMTGRRPMLSAVAAGGVALLLVICIGCAGVGGWWLWQNQGGLLAGVDPQIAIDVTPSAETTARLATATLSATPSPTSDVIDETVLQSPIDSPLPTPTLPPTNTPTAAPQQEPTQTATPIPIPTLVPETPEPPTVTPEPTETPTPEPTATPESAEEPVPTESPTPESSPTPVFKYDAPKLIGPPSGQFYSGINEIILEWEAVEELAPDEQYAFRLVYPYNGQITYGGANIKENRWVVPLQLYGKIDPPDNTYEWFVVVERLNEDGSGTAISPESERWTFTWK